MTKKTFMLLPIMLLLTACSNNRDIQIEENNKIKDASSLNASNISYNDYKSAYESENNKLKDRPHLRYEPKISKTSYDKLVLTNDENASNDTPTSKILTKKQAFLDFYGDWKNVKYKMGGTSRTGIDCSGFTQKAFKEKFGIELPRTTTTQVKVGVEVKKSELKMGDLVFFKTSKVTKHVGIYMGNGSFLHSSIKGIQFTKLDKPFYKQTYWTARRIIN
ncbi:outer membrane lipoprotein, NlpC/P60 family [Arcobacter venerupis]|uniref:Outer membrane lipoprotein, NlpC/P60 family n=1 Tax=Arcobacter venerupis TaxID=1054033 RepID=A0AAE7BA51_9BACT|nr:NlpC/P60 family protein [Arcobacter venerupis]QKF68278.1 outer membrane lipoprotein, NlpC/P60 family [Arcobacter venerupis]